MKKGNPATIQPLYYPDRMIVIIALVAFVPAIWLLQYFQQHIEPFLLVKTLPILHIIAEYISIFVSVSIFLLAWHTYPNRRDAFILFLGNVLLVVGLLSMFYVLYYHQDQSIIKDIMPVNIKYFSVIKHIFLPSGLLLSIFTVDKPFLISRRFYYLSGAILFFIIIIVLGLQLYSLPNPSELLPQKYDALGLTDQRALTIPLYIMAIFIYYKKKPFTDLKLNSWFLSAIILCMYAEAFSTGLCLGWEDCLHKVCSPFSHIFKIGAYSIIYWVVFVSSIRYPYKALYQIKESLAENYRQLSAALEKSDQSEERYRLLVENSNDLIYTLDTYSRITFVNQKISALTGYMPAELYGKSVFDFLAPESRRRAIAQTRTLLKTGRTQTEDLEILAKDGKVKSVMVNVQLIRDTEGRIVGFQGIARDISERKQQQEQMLHSERLATVGLIASGIAHEIGTPLNIISGNAEFLLADLPKHHPMREELETIVDQCQRISDQVKTLLDFGRPSLLQLTPLALDEIIRSTLQLLRHMIKPNHNIELNLAPDLPHLMGDKYKLQQLFLNLFLNAFQAMPTGGILQVSTSLTMELNDYGNKRPYVEVRIKDSGQGIPEENLKHIFSPFFTTKKGVQGTGLGLAVCLRIVKDHGGAIEVESKMKKGTTFIIHLPIKHFKDETEEGPISHG